MAYSFDQIKRGLDNDEFVLHYQPKVDFLTGRVSGAEALIRWQTRDRGLVPPSEFIPVAAESGFVPQITERMFPRFVDECRRINGKALNTVFSFNVSAQDLERGNLLSMIRESVRDGTIRPGQLEIEVTEGCRIGESASTSRTVSALVSSGIEFSMDDYGTGFSSLETLNRLPFSAIKLDQSFVVKMLNSFKSATLIKTSIAAAQMLGIKTTVEGVESEAIYRSLMHSGCTQGQGYWICHPIPLQEYASFLDGGRRWPSSPIGTLRMAQITHNWQYKLLVDLVCSMMQDKETDLSALDQVHVDHYECALGRWYYGPGQDFRGAPEFDDLEISHKQMHETCELIAEALGAGGDIRRIRGLLEYLSSKAILVTNALERLETRLLIEEMGTAPQADASEAERRVKPAP